MTLSTHCFNFRKENKVIIDTNIYFYMCSPKHKNEQRMSRKYDKIFSDIVANKNIEILLSDIQISEIINAFMKRELKSFNDNKKTNLTLKEFRKKEEYKEAVIELEEIFKAQILRVTTLCNPSVKIEEIVIEYFESYNLDFNDLYLIKWAKEFNIPIITNDSDFFNCDGVKIYTEN